MDLSFFVAVPNPLVRLDLEGALKEQFPDSSVIADKSLEKLSDVMLAGPTCLIIAGKLLADETATVVRDMMASGAHLVMVGDGAGPEFAGQVLELPFTNQSIFDAIARVAFSQR